MPSLLAVADRQYFALRFAGEFRYLDTKGSNLSQIEETITLPEMVEAPVTWNCR